MNAQAWLERARVDSRSAKAVVEQRAPELRVKAVSDVQQACEKATKAILIAQGMSVPEVTRLGHNTIGAFVNLIAHMLDANPIAEDFSRAVLKEDATESAKTLTKLVLSGRRNKVLRGKVLLAWKQVLPEAASTLGNNALQVEEWRRLTRAFPPVLVEAFIEFHEKFIAMWGQYIIEIANEDVDPRPLLSKSIPPETWVFGPAYAGLPKRFPGQETDAPLNPILVNLAHQVLNESIEQISRGRNRKHWPKTVNIRQLLIHISNWLTSLGWLFLCATVTTPHATSSRYPAELGSNSNEIGSQHYNDQLGVVACIGPLAVHTDDAIQKLIRHYRQIEDGYRHMVR